MSLAIGTGKAGEVNEMLDALSVCRDDHEKFGELFLGRVPHPGQLRFLQDADATVNVLATANRWGKTTTLTQRHYHSLIYKRGGENSFVDQETGILDIQAFEKLRYNTIHTADDFENTVTLVWDDALRVHGQSKLLQAFISDTPRSKPPHIDFIHGARWKFRTLGHDASGIDGHSFYLVTVDEAGWIPRLETMMTNVIRVRVADVSGRIDLVGTFKPGISKDFYKFAVRASAHTGVGISFDHRTSDSEIDASLDTSLKRYLHEWLSQMRGRELDLEPGLVKSLASIGIDLDEYADALSR